MPLNELLKGVVYKDVREQNCEQLKMNLI
jgi:hypothetical protein